MRFLWDFGHEIFVIQHRTFVIQRETFLIQRETFANNAKQNLTTVSFSAFDGPSTTDMQASFCGPKLCLTSPRTLLTTRQLVWECWPDWVCWATLYSSTYWELHVTSHLRVSKDVTEHWRYVPPKNWSTRPWFCWFAQSAEVHWSTFKWHECVLNTGWLIS
jgi:hypothetical protein